MFDYHVRNTIVPLLLRLGLAAVFIFHGLGKVNADTNWGTSWGDKMGLPLYQQALVAWGELIGGIALAVGFLTRLAALGIFVIMAGAVAQVHWKHGFSLKDEGFEYNFILIIMCVAVFLMGPGTLAVDRFFRVGGRRSRA
jgi:putative oxidoreductase